MRVATIPLQQSTILGIQRAQYQLALQQKQLASGKKAPDLASLGSEAVRTLSARTLLVKQEAQGQNATRLGTTLSLIEAALTALENGTMDIATRLSTAAGTGEGTGLTDAMEAGFEQFRTLINATEGGLPLFGGGITGSPFTATSAHEMISLSVDDFFQNGKVIAQARVGDQLDVSYGILASDLGRAMAKVYRNFAQDGPYGAQLTVAQKASVADLRLRMDEAISAVRGLNASNGRRLAQTEVLAERAEERALVLRDVIGRNEDADLAQVAIDLAMHKTMLEASYSVFSQLNQLSLLRYLQ